eukprot:11353960-Alexandrium_andersonii.AAC.1
MCIRDSRKLLKKAAQSCSKLLAAAQSCFQGRFTFSGSPSGAARRNTLAPVRVPMHLWSQHACH